MKKLIAFICMILVCTLLAACNPPIPSNPSVGGGDENPPIETPVQKRILNADGSYGGTLNAELYGEGAPLNGEYDHVDSGYYMNTDYYSLNSTATRTIFPNVATYQQTMADSSGLACALMVMAYSGEDVSVNNELKLVNDYEALTGTTVYGNGTTAEGLVELFTKHGYAARTGEYAETGSTQEENFGIFTAWAKNHLDNGRFIMVRYQDASKGGWKLIIGLDDMGTEINRDNVLIFADPYDVSDHNQDGYSIEGLGRFYRWWQQMEYSGEYTDRCDYLVVAPKVIVNHVRGESNIVRTKAVPDLYLYLNPDGTYGGGREGKESVYGTGATFNGANNHLDSIYYSMPDYYNMESTATRTILTNYRAFQQTMASSCGICSTMTVLLYYGFDYKALGCESVLDFEEWLVLTYEDINDDIIYNSGVGSKGLHALTTSMGFNPTKGSYSKANFQNPEASMEFPTYLEFTTWAQTNLLKGTPMPISFRPHSGHWEVIIGYDDMGTSFIYDDVLVFADSGDSWDHYQDGYNTYPATLFFRQWYNGSFTYNQQFNIFDKLA